MESKNAWGRFMPRFRLPKYLPERLTSIVQPIDRHLGIIYKRAVYRAFRSEFLRRMREAGPGVRPEPMTAAEKRILITKAIGDAHERVWGTDKFYRAFIATGTWMPVRHLVPHIDTPTQGLLLSHTHTHHTHTYDDVPYI